MQDVPAEGLLYRAGDGHIDLALRVLHHLVALRTARGRDPARRHGPRRDRKVFQQPVEEEVERGGEYQYEDYPDYFLASFIASLNASTSRFKSALSF